MDSVCLSVCFCDRRVSASDSADAKERKEAELAGEQKSRVARGESFSSKKCACYSPTSRCCRANCAGRERAAYLPLFMLAPLAQVPFRVPPPRRAPLFAFGWRLSVSFVWPVPSRKRPRGCDGQSREPPPSGSKFNWHKAGEQPVAAAASWETRSRFTFRYGFRSRFRLLLLSSRWLWPTGKRAANPIAGRSVGRRTGSQAASARERERP